MPSCEHRGPASLMDLAWMRPEQYRRIFAQAATPNIEDFRGSVLRGLILHIRFGHLGAVGFNLYTGRWRELFSGRDYMLQRVFENRFYARDDERGESGVNFWPTRGGTGREIMPMRLEMSPGCGNPEEMTLKMDYRVPSNTPLITRPLLDEVKQIPGTNLYIGKLFFRTFLGKVFFLWFALERQAP